MSWLADFSAGWYREGRYIRLHCLSGPLHDVCNAFYAFYEAPRCAAVYNLGGGRENSISINEAVDAMSDLFGTTVNTEYVEQNRVGDHICYITDLRRFRHAFGKPYLRVRRLDFGQPDDFLGLEQQFDTALIINVLEHVPDEHTALKSLWSVLQPGGRVIVLVPQHPGLYGTLDAALDHRERYSRDGLQRSLTKAGFRVERIFDFNRVSVPGWWVAGRVLRRKTFSRVPLKALEVAMPILRRVDRLWPWSGLSLIAVAVKDEQPRVCSCDDLPTCGRPYCSM